MRRSRGTTRIGARCSIDLQGTQEGSLDLPATSSAGHCPSALTRSSLAPRGRACYPNAMARPTFWNKLGFVAFSGAMVAAGALLHAACEDPKSHAAQKPEDLTETLAKIDDVGITVGDFQDRINYQSPYWRGR